MVNEMLVDLKETVSNAELFQVMLAPLFKDASVEAWQLAIALDWARQEKIAFVWFRENSQGLTYNGLALVNEHNVVLHSEVTGFYDDNDKLLQEAINAHMLMHEMDIDIEDGFN